MTQYPATTRKMVTSRTRVALNSALQKILRNPDSKRSAAKQLEHRIHEVNRLAKATSDPVEKAHLYAKKTTFVLFGVEHLGFKPLSWEWDSRSKCAVVLYKIRKSTVHLLSTSIPNLDLSRLRRETTLVQSRRARLTASLNASLKPAFR